MRYNLPKAIGLVTVSVVIRYKLDINLEMFEWVIFCLGLALCSYEFKEVKK